MICLNPLITKDNLHLSVDIKWPSILLRVFYDGSLYLLGAVTIRLIITRGFSTKVRRIQATCATLRKLGLQIKIIV